MILHWLVTGNLFHRRKTTPSLRRNLLVENITNNLIWSLYNVLLLRTAAEFVSQISRFVFFFFLLHKIYDPPQTNCHWLVGALHIKKLQLLVLNSSGTWYALIITPSTYLPLEDIFQIL